MYKSLCGHLFWSFLYKIHFWLMLPDFKISAFDWNWYWFFFFFFPSKISLMRRFFWRLGYGIKKKKNPPFFSFIPSSIFKRTAHSSVVISPFLVAKKKDKKIDHSLKLYLIINVMYLNIFRERKWKRTGQVWNFACSFSSGTKISLSSKSWSSCCSVSFSNGFSSEGNC